MAERVSDSGYINLTTSSQGFLIRLSLEENVMKQNFSSLSNEIMDMYRDCVAEDFAVSADFKSNLQALNPMYQEYLDESKEYIRETKNEDADNFSSADDSLQDENWLEEI